jgi:hypothetical protein
VEVSKVGSLLASRQIPIDCLDKELVIVVAWNDY